MARSDAAKVTHSMMMVQYVSWAATSQPQALCELEESLHGLGCAATVAEIETVANVISTLRGPVSLTPISRAQVQVWIDRHPEEWASVDRWQHTMSAAGTPYALHDSPRGVLHCVSLVVAYLIGHDIAADAWLACYESGIRSATSGISDPVCRGRTIQLARPIQGRINLDDVPLQ